MDQKEREQIAERVAHAYRVLAKQICAVAMTSWRRFYIRLYLMGDPETDRRSSVKEFRARRHVRRELNDNIEDIETFFESDWYKDVLCGMCPEMVLCPFEEYKKSVYEDIENGRISEADTEES